MLFILFYFFRRHNVKIFCQTVECCSLVTRIPTRLDGPYELVVHAIRVV